MVNYKLKLLLFIQLTLLYTVTKSTSHNELQSQMEAAIQKVTPKTTVNVNAPDTMQVIENIEEGIINIKHDTNELTRQLPVSQRTTSYAVTLRFDRRNNTFAGSVLINVQRAVITPIVISFHVQNLNIYSVMIRVGTTDSPVNYLVANGVLQIFPLGTSNFYDIVIEYSGVIGTDGRGIFRANDNSYIGMNLHPMHARRVFPCKDEPDQSPSVTFTFNNVTFPNIVGNSITQINTTYTTQLFPLQGPPNSWGMIAHSYPSFGLGLLQVQLYGRPGYQNQNALASTAAINIFYELERWTAKPYFQIVINQRHQLAIVALPDISVEWNALSSICLWEPYILAEVNHSIAQRKDVLTNLAESMSRQWFGYDIHPQNWRHQWVISGLRTYAAYEVLRLFPQITFASPLDINTLFVTDVIQESLLRDSYMSSPSLDPGHDLFDQPSVRDHVNGLLNYKAPAILRMLRFVLGRQADDYIHRAAVLLLNRSPGPVISTNFFDAINLFWDYNNNEYLYDVQEFLRPWMSVRGYPLVTVDLRQGGARGVHVTQESFGFSSTPRVSYMIPLTYTTSSVSNFSIANMHDITMLTSSATIMPMQLNQPTDFVLFNIQGQGYYRVNYDFQLWNRIIVALNVTARRTLIHPLNRATLLDDALNVARAGKLDYETALLVARTMEHETEYAVWKAYVRNMDFIRKRLVALVSFNETLYSNVYVRMLNTTVSTFEEQIGFSFNPQTAEPAMRTLTRGLVMDHACRANFQRCVNASFEWFWTSAVNPVINPNIPRDIRPAVYCTVVREGDSRVMDALYARLNVEQSTYERVVILESLGCSRDDNFTRSLLRETIADNSQLGTEERTRIFAAIAASSPNNTRLAFNFMKSRSVEMAQTYGGPENLERLIYILADNIVTPELAVEFILWVIDEYNYLGDSREAARRASYIVYENLVWQNNSLLYVYDWIDGNFARDGANTLFVSLIAICMTFIITLFN